MTACTECLARSWLLERLAGWIEQVAVNSPGKRARDLLSLPDDQLAAALHHPQPARLAELARDEGAAAVADAVDRGDGWAICAHDSDWPPSLADLGDAAPRALFGAGDRARLRRTADRPAVGIVGARRATTYGKEVATALARQIASAGLPVVSGLAYGVDAAAHRGALDGAGMTIAVLGSGANVAYPPGERALHRRVIAEGVVLSEMPPGFRPFKWSFPARNRIIAALATMTVVVQARRRSGALITAQMAAEDLGREVGAVPGPVNSALSDGANALLADGAAVVRDAQDVLDRLLGIGVVGEAELVAPAPLPPELTAVLSAVDGGAGTADEVSSDTRLPAHETGAALSRLELLGYVSTDALGRYSRSPHARSRQGAGSAGDRRL